MRPRLLIATVTGLFTVCGAAFSMHAAEDADPARTTWQRPAAWNEIVADEAKLDAYRCPKPDELAIVFSFGYAGDAMPKEIDKYEQMIVKAKEAGFNVIYGTYTPRRLEVIRKHGMKMMIDFLDVENHHVYKSPEKAAEVAKAVEGDAAVWGYNIWNDHMSGVEAGRGRDIRTVRRWDPSHPAYSGGCANDNHRLQTNADVMGYYDFHWERGIQLHFPHLLQYLQGSREHDSYPYTWLSWRPAKYTDYYHRSRWSANTALACGMKGIMWFLAPMDHQTLEWRGDAGHILRVNKELLPLKDEIVKIGLPSAVYATAITKDRENKDLPDDQAGKLPAALGNHAVPGDFWLQPVSGEIVMGVFRHADGGDAIYVANYNSQADQDVKLKVIGDSRATIFSRATGRYEPLKVQDGAVSFPLEAGDGALIRFTPVPG